MDCYGQHRRYKCGLKKFFGELTGPQEKLLGACTIRLKEKRWESSEQTYRGNEVTQFKKTREEIETQCNTEGWQARAIIDCYGQHRSREMARVLFDCYGQHRSRPLARVLFD